MKLTKAEDFGLAVKTRRKQLGYTQAYISGVTGFSTSFISDLENGKKTAELGKALDNVSFSVEKGEFVSIVGASNSSVGIGLSMSKQIIMRQNGNIAVESEVGKGSTFLLKLY